MVNINTFPNLLTDQEAFRLWSYANEAQYVRAWKSDVYTHKPNGRFVHHIAPDLFLVEYAELWKRIENSSGYSLNLRDAYINCSNPQTTTLTHYDSYEDSSLTILIYLNQSWDKDWGGYTVFFREMNGNDVVGVEVPEYKKAVIFEGKIPHLAMPTDSNAPDRFTLAIKTRRADG
jgi:hypothetical protein